MKEFHIEIAVEKAVIPELGALKGYGNGDTVVVAGREHAPGTLVFLGFVSPGKSPEDGKWHGVLKFAYGETPEWQRKPMKRLIPPDLKDVPHDQCPPSEIGELPPETEIDDDVDDSN